VIFTHLLLFPESFLRPVVGNEKEIAAVSFFAFSSNYLGFSFLFLSNVGALLASIINIVELRLSARPYYYL